MIFLEMILRFLLGGRESVKVLKKTIKKDTITRDYMSDNEVFADVFNQFLFHGEIVLTSDTLTPVDTSAFTVLYGETGTDTSIQRFRDVLKLGIAKKNKTVVYLLLGIENQSEIHFAMPVRNMLYDALAYTEQVEATAKRHRLERKQKSEQKRRRISALQAGQDQKRTSGQPSAAEYLSGFYRDDCLIPVVTLVVYFGADEWDAPKSLHEMLECRDEKVLSFVTDYRLNLIAPAQMSEEEIGHFTTSFREVMLFIKYSADKRRLSKLVEEDSAFRKVDRKAARVISSVTGSDLKFDENEEEIDMCLAIDGIREDARKEGLSQGLSQGLKEGLLQGTLQASTETAQRMLRAGKYALEDIAEISGLEIGKVLKLKEMVDTESVLDK